MSFQSPRHICRWSVFHQSLGVIKRVKQSEQCLQPAFRAKIMIEEVELHPHLGVFFLLHVNIIDGLHLCCNPRGTSQLKQSVEVAGYVGIITIKREQSSLYLCSADSFSTFQVKRQTEGRKRCIHILNTQNRYAFGSVPECSYHLLHWCIYLSYGLFVFISPQCFYISQIQIHQPQIVFNRNVPIYLFVPCTMSHNVNSFTIPRVRNLSQMDFFASMSGPSSQACTQVQRSTAVYTPLHKDWWMLRRLLLLSSVIPLQDTSCRAEVAFCRCCP